MTFNAAQESREDAQPITIYAFHLGPNNVLRVTDAQSDVQDEDLNIYTPEPIEIGPLTVTGELDETEVSITMPEDAGLATRFLIYPPAQEVAVVVRAGDVDETDYSLLFTGRVLSCNRENGRAVLRCEPTSASLERPNLRRNWQLTCPHVLYGPQCMASEAAATTTHQVVAIGNTSVTLTAGWEGANDIKDYIGGKVKWPNPDGGTETFTILRTTATVIDIGGVVRDLAVNDDVDVVLGCNHKPDGCEFVQNNIRRYGGQEGIPVKNPWTSLSAFE